MEEKDIAQLFLFNFISELAQAATPAKFAEEDYQIQQVILPSIKQQEKIVMPVIKPVKQTLEIMAPPPRIPRAVMPRIPQQRPSYTEAQRTEINQQPAAQKLNFLIKDPAVTEIECTGADQSLLVKKAGSIQKTPIKLSIEEIYELIAEFSQKTRIPILDGTLKAALNNLIITAVLSEILGPRFILQKKNPFQQLI